LRSTAWLFGLAFWTLSLSPQTPCHPEISYGEKCEERKTKKKKESTLYLNQQTEAPQHASNANPKSKLISDSFEAMAALGQGIGHAINNLFTIRISEESGWKKKEYEESTNSPISTLTPVFNNLQKVGSP
jgi:hypothetical protein